MYPFAVTFAFLQDGSPVQVFGLDKSLEEQVERVNDMGRANDSSVPGAVRMEVWTRGPRIAACTHFVPAPLPDPPAVVAPPVVEPVLDPPVEDPPPVDPPVDPEPSTTPPSVSGKRKQSP